MIARQLTIGLLSLLLLVCSCSSGSDRVEHEVPAGLIPAEAPEGVSPELWKQLSAELERVLAEEGTAKRPSQVPTGSGSKVLDFGIYSDNVPQYEFRWTYRNQGDYDANGLVTIADLTPVGVYFGARFGDPDWLLAQRADGDNNGEVNIADVTPIGVNFNGRIDGFVLQGFNQSSQEWQDELLIPMTGIAEQGPAAMHYEWVNAPLVLSAMRIQPYVSLGAEIERGIGSNVIERRASVSTYWPTLRANAFRNAISATLGPSSTDELMEVPLQGQYNEPCTPISDENGIIFVCSVTNAEELLALDNETILSAVGPDGTVLWTRRLPGAAVMTPTMGLNGLLLVATTRKVLYAFTAEGKLYWQRQVPGIPLYGSFIVDFAGSSYMLNEEEISGDALVVKRDRDGTELWTRGNSLPSSHPLFYTPLGVSWFMDETILRTVSEDGQTVFDTQILGACDKPFVDPCVFYIPQQDIGSLLVPLEAPSELSIIGLGSSPSATYDPLGSFEAGPTINVDGQLIVPVVDQAENNELRLLDPDGTEIWDRHLPGRILHYVASDFDNRMYYCMRMNDGDGTYSGRVVCYSSNQVEIWGIDFPDRVPYAPIIADEGRLAFMLANVEDPDDLSLVLVGE